MFGCECFCWDQESVSELSPFESPPSTLPSPLPQWPEGHDFATGRIKLGELEVIKVTKFESVWSCSAQRGKTSSVTFYKPSGIPDGFFSLGHYCQPNAKPLGGYVLAARDVQESSITKVMSDFPALTEPLNFKLIWSSKSPQEGPVYVWLPKAPIGYTAMGFVVTNSPGGPNLDEVRCVRNDLTESSEGCAMILNAVSTSTHYVLKVWNTRPCDRGILATGVPVGTFFCSTYQSSEDDLNISCLRNFDLGLRAMPNVDQIHALIKNYGPTVFFHPDEEYLPSSVSWFFKNGALLYSSRNPKGQAIDFKGSNLPAVGENDGEYWLDLPEDEELRNYAKHGDINTAKLYVHVKPALGGSFTDIVMWIFCPFNGPATLKAGLVKSIPLNKVGEHVSDWEHFTLRFCNFAGELHSVYFSEHSGGKWLDASDLEFIDGNKAVVYASKNGHASFPHPGCYIQGSSKLGIGVRNDVARSKYVVDSSTKYQIVAAEYLGKGVIEEPDWLQYMREWGPTIVYDSRSEIDKIINYLPFFFRFSVEILFELFPTELYGEEGPTGPKEKDNWLGDERS